MSNALTIEFALSGSEKVAAFFGHLAVLSDHSAKSLHLADTAASSAAQSYHALNAEVERFNRLTNGPAGRFPAINIGQGPARGGGFPVRAARFVSGPFQRQEAPEQVTSGPKGLGAKFLDVLKTSRFGVGAGGQMEMMPLVGRTAGLAAEALGPEMMALAGPVGIVVGGLTAAASAAFSFAKNAADLGTAYAARGFAVGNLGTGGALAGMVGGADAAGKANAFNDAITSGSGMGRLYGLELGQFNIAGPMGKVDISGQYTGAVDRLRALYKRNPEEAMRAAKATNLTGDLHWGQASDSQYGYTRQDAGTSSQHLNEDYLKASENFQDAVGRTKTASDTLAAALGAPLLGPLAAFENGLANSANRLTEWLKTDMGKTASGFLATVLGGPVGALATAGYGQQALGLGLTFAGGPLGGGLAAFSGSGQDGGAVNEGAGKDAANTAAMKENTSALIDLNGKMSVSLGSDPQGRRAAAFPAAAGIGAFNGLNGTRDQYVQGAFRVGAFA